VWQVLVQEGLVRHSWQGYGMKNLAQNHNSDDCVTTCGNCNPPNHSTESNMIEIEKINKATCQEEEDG
jgi:hypothetical protein